MLKNNKNVLRFAFGAGCLDEAAPLFDELRSAKGAETGRIVFFIDHFFKDGRLAARLPVADDDRIVYVDTTDEPKTGGIDALVADLEADGLRAEGGRSACVVGVGGGITLDTAKAVANLLTNPGKAADYQGWDLVANPAVYKVGVPTLSGTGAETSRTCVLTNTEKLLKLGMNSDHTIYDQLILDPALTATAPRDQYFFTGMDTYIHCVESLKGRYRNPVGDSFSREALELCREVFTAKDMMDDAAREKLMVASYLGGIAIAHSFVGLVHPFSAALSVVLGAHHGVGNCIALAAMEEFYPEEAAFLKEMARDQGVAIPQGLTAGADDRTFEDLYAGTIIHEKPLANALGDGFKNVLTRDKVRSVFERM